jgi:glutamate N-acetyltransferase/amino-acid N-acetyltransferase
MNEMHRIPGGVVAARGFRAAGIHCGIKPAGKYDLALIVSDKPAAVAAMFTTNKVKAAPVKLSMQHAKSGRARAIVANSGNANACTGEIGAIHARAMCAAVADRLGFRRSEVLVCSTGRIGVLMPIVKIEAGIKKIIKKLRHERGENVARAIMTTDTFPKQVAVSVKSGKNFVHVGGIAKGAGMIHPNMATMLCFITTDAQISVAQLRKSLRKSVENSFNRISIDGDMSTNDTVIALANGASGKISAQKFQKALDFVCLGLAKMIVHDGEGVTKFITLHVRGAKNDRDAERAARAVANSMLVKTSWCGGDPNWGRILDAVGYSGAAVTESRVNIFYDNVQAVRNGLGVSKNFRKAKHVAAKHNFEITVDLRLGRGRCTMFTCDLSEEYVTLNKGE